MAGRGRGRQSSSLTQEQLQVLGCIGKDVPVGTTAPPPTFPSLLNRPVPLEISTANDYMILWKEDFLTHMRESPYYLESIPSGKGNNNIKRYSDQFVTALESSKEKSKAEIPWHLMPAELKPNWKRRKATTAAGTQAVKKKKIVQGIEDRLKKLEQKEKTDDSEVEKPKNRSRPNRIESDSDDDKEDDEIGQDEDEEMDEDNDYGNNYFDNGETFNEEDDNLDDGPIY